MNTEYWKPPNRPWIFVQFSVVCNLQFGIFNNRPSQPRYTFICDVEKALHYLKEFAFGFWRHSEPPKDLSDKELPMKATMTLDLISATQYSEISHLNIKFTATADGKYLFYFHKLTRVWYRNRPQLHLRISRIWARQIFVMFLYCTCTYKAANPGHWMIKKASCY